MPFSHTAPIRVRYSDCDAQGHVFNANYFTYFDIGITELFRAAIGSYGALLDQGVDLVVVEAGATFRAPARFDDIVDIEATVERLGTTSIVTAMRLLRDGAALVEGRIAHVFIRAGTTQKTPIPPAIRAVLEG